MARRAGSLWDSGPASYAIRGNSRIKDWLRIEKAISATLYERVGLGVATLFAPSVGDVLAIFDQAANARRTSR
jgi:hypothetical protein